jgi:predicted RNA-binding Zn ribbon-like protein
MDGSRRIFSRDDTGDVHDMKRRDFGRLVAGHLALNFVNTVGGRVRRKGRARQREYLDLVVHERLVSYAALVEWATVVGVVRRSQAARLVASAEVRPAAAAAVLRRGIALREALYRIFKASFEGWRPDADDVTTVDRELHIARAHERLVAGPPFAWVWDARAEDLDVVLWPVVRSAAELLTSAELERIGQCPGEVCGWLFLDTSRARRRRWCDMADCGNIAKVNRFRQRHAKRGA